MNRIYGLVDPRDGKVRYVGRTSQPMNKRLTGHFHQRRETSHTRRDHWIASLWKIGLRPTIVCLAVVNDNVFEAEKWWIAKLRGIGMDLVNAHDGGGGCIPGVRPPKRSVSPETREKISATLKGRKIGFAIGCGTPHYQTKDEESERRRCEHLRQPATEERKRKVRDSNIKTWSDPVLRALNSERTKIQAATPEWKDKYREVQKRRWAKVSPQDRQDFCKRMCSGVKV